MKKTALIIALLIGTLQLSAFNITGKIYDKNTRDVLDFANVSLTPKGSDIPVGGTTTSATGEFELANISSGTYTLKVSFLGYNDFEQQVVVKNDDVNLGKIYLSEDSKQLQEVEVVGQGSTMRFELDRKVFSVDQNIAASGGSVTDVLENIPSVDVDQEGNIALRNNDAVEIWINGKPAGLTADNRAQVLQQIPAETIKEIEVITNPSAKFSPEGTAGIINLVLKKDRKAGYYGSVNGGIQYPWGGLPGGNVGANINFNKGIVDAYANVGYHYHSSHGGTQTDRLNLNGTDTISRLQQNATNDRGGGGFFLRAGIDLRITDHSTLGFSGFGLVGDNSRSKSTSNYLLTDYNSLDTLRLYNRNENNTGNHPGGNAMITYQYKPQKNHSLDLSASYNNFSWNEDNTYTQIELDTLQQLQTTRNTDQMVQVKADYEWKPTEQSRLEAGYQLDLAWRLTKADAYDLQAYNRTQMKNYFNDFMNQEQIHALYITYGNRFWDRFSLQVGLRGEYMQRHLDTKYYNSTDSEVRVTQDTSYLQLFPSAYLSYSFPNGHELQLNYTRRIDRPRGHQINPRQDFSDSTNIRIGNPSLLPAFSSSLELNYLKQWEKHTLSAGVFYRFADGVIQNVKYMDGSVMKNTFVNVANRSEVGVEVVGKNRLFKNILQLTTSVNFYYNYMSADEYHATMYGSPIDIKLPRQDIFAWSARINAQFMFTKTFSGQLSARYSSPRVVAQGQSSHNYSIDLGLRKTFLDKRLALNLMVRDLLNSRSRATTTWGDGFWQYQQRRWNSRTIGLTLTYNFGNMQENRRPKASDNVDTGMDYSGAEE